jgi:tetratricopeptide (TPR) repeat protein
MKYLATLGAVALGLAAANALALDSVRQIKGTANGKVVKMSPVEVEVEGAGGVTKTVPVNEIVYITWDSEPSALATARQRLTEAGGPEAALAALKKIEVETLTRPELKQEVEFLTALWTAQLALGGQGDLKDAGRLMTAFVTTHKGNYHWLQANEVLGDLCVAAGAHSKAAECFAQVAKAPWPDYKMRAGVAIGRALLAQNQTADALKQFEEVLAMKEEGELAQAQRLAATLGKARCLAADKRHEEAIKMVDAIIAKTDPDQRELMALAYNTLGTAHRAAGRKKEALFAFLHVDLIYNGSPEAHAEALANLVQLWKDDSKPERADRCMQLLGQRYRNSRWAQQAGG